MITQRKIMPKWVSGFTITEVLVSLSIMVAILTVIILNQSSYTEKIGLANLADQISLSLSQAQTYGIAVRELAPGSENFTVAYGMSFSKLPSDSPSAYIFFADRDEDGAYSDDWGCPTDETSECLEKVEMRQGNLIDEICIIEENGDEDCQAPQRVDISFERPKTEANFAVFDSNGQSIDTSTAQGVKVLLSSPNAFERLVVVYKVGQISALEPVYEYQYPTPAYDYPSPQAYGTPYVYQTPIVYRDLTVTKLGSGQGTVSGAGINCGPACSSESVLQPSGSQVTLTATPEGANNAFTGWSGNCTGIGSCVLIMDASKIARATFTRVGPTVIAFDMQPRTTLSSTKATFTVTDSNAGVYLASADLRRATKSDTCTTSIDTGCTWSTVATSKAGKDVVPLPGGSGNVSISNNSITKNAGGEALWNAGSISTETIASGDGYVEFTSTTANYKMAGLGNTNSSHSYDDIEYAIYLMDGATLNVYEKALDGNIYARGPFGSYAANDVFRVAVESGVVKYYKNGVLFYTSTVSPATRYPLTFDSSIYYLSQGFNNIKISSATSDNWSGALFDTPAQGSSYIYDLYAYDTTTPTPRYGSAPAKIQVDAGDYGVPVVTAFDVQPRTNAANAKATFTATDTGGSYLNKADLMRADKNASCTVSDDSGCTWSVMSTSKAGTGVTWTSGVGATPSGSNLTQTGVDGWSNGAISTQTITSGDGYVEFTIPSTGHWVMAGLGSGDSSQHYNDIEYAAYAVSGAGLHVYEAGNWRGALGTYAAGDTFRVAIESGVVKYYKNGVVFYTSTKSPTSGFDGVYGTYSYPYRFDTSFYAYQNANTITNAKISSNTSDNWSGALFNAPPSGTYIYGLNVYDNNSPINNRGTEPARIEVTTDSGAPNTFSPDAGGTLPNSLVAYWKLDEVSGNRADSKGSNTLTDNNTVTSVAGKKGNAASFAPASVEYLSSNDNAALSTGDIDFTLAGWVKMNTKNNYNTLLAKYDTATGFREYWLGYHYGVDRMTFYIYAGGGPAVGFVASDNFGNMATDVWYFVLVEHDATNNKVRISINNVPADSGDTTGAPADSTAPFFMGYDTTVADLMNGQMDEWGFWKRLLTAQEKADLYNAGAGNTYNP